MNYVEVKALLDAGFTADEIRGMMGNVQTNNPQNPQNNPQDLSPDTAEQISTVPDSPVPDSDPVNSSDPVPVPGNKTDQDFSALNATMERLIKTIQTSNLRSDSFSAPAAKDLDSQVDSIMGSIIRPERKEGGSAQ